MSIIPIELNTPIDLAELTHLIQFLDNYAVNRHAHREALHACVTQLLSIANNPKSINYCFRRDDHA